MPGAPATSRNCARPIPTPSNTSSRSRISELLLQLTMFTNVIHNKDSVEALGKDYGIKGADGTGPWCFERWQPRTEIVLKRHDAYKWGPSMYKNKGPVKFEKLGHQDRARGFQPRRGDDGRPVRHHPPVSGAVHHPGQGRPDADGDRGEAQLPAALFRLQDDAADGRRQARARGHEHRHQPRRDRQGASCSAMPIRPSPSSTRTRSTTTRRPRASSRKTSNAPRNCSTKPAGSPAPTASARRTA